MDADSIKSEPSQTSENQTPPGSEPEPTPAPSTAPLANPIARLAFQVERDDWVNPHECFLYLNKELKAQKRRAKRERKRLREETAELRYLFQHLEGRVDDISLNLQTLVDNLNEGSDKDHPRKRRRQESDADVAIMSALEKVRGWAEKMASRTNGS